MLASLGQKIRCRLKRTSAIENLEDVEIPTFGNLERRPKIYNGAKESSACAGLTTVQGTDSAAVGNRGEFSYVKSARVARQAEPSRRLLVATTTHKST